MEELMWIRKGDIPVVRQEMGINGVPYLTFPLLDETGIVKQGFSTRLGGVSTGYCASMNFSVKQYDTAENVKTNYKRMADALLILPKRIVQSQQTHTTNVRVVTEEDAGKGYHRERDYTDVDGLVTNIPGITLVTHFADCVPLYFVDPVHRAIGLSHSGWRGTVARMGRETLHVMHREYDTNPEDVFCAIGPSICKDCYEVSEDVADHFKTLTDTLAADGLRIDGRVPVWQDILEEKGNGKYQLDLWEANRRILLCEGVKADHIQVTDLCTCCNASLLHSHRATQGKRGTLAAFLCLKYGHC